jgi:hypothetical protein
MRIPPALIELSDKTADATQASPILSYEDQLTKVIAKLCNFRADMRDGVIVDRADILSIVFAIDSELAGLVSNVSPSFSYTICKWSDSRSFRINEDCSLSSYNGYFHVYESFWVYNFWNSYRYARIFVNEIILGELKSITAQAESPQPRVITGINVAVSVTWCDNAADICSTVPSRFGVDSVTGKVQNPSILKTAGGFTLLFPLYVAACVDDYPKPVCTWVIDCLEITGLVLGIDTALALIDVLLTEPAWSTGSKGLVLRSFRIILPSAWKFPTT